jgi:hypothetical protein
LSKPWEGTTPEVRGPAVDGLATSRSARAAALAKNSSKVRSELCVAGKEMLAVETKVTTSLTRQLTIDGIAQIKEVINSNRFADVHRNSRLLSCLSFGTFLGSRL